MKYRILYTETYVRQAKKFIKKHPEIIGQYEKTLRLMEIDSFHPSLRLHKLKGRLSDLHSVSINISYRIVIEFLIQGNTIIPVTVGSHDEAY
jgi:mRNA-degrading endonuclease YafQ of YafQ-DinJ toxin-antitoxin module